MVESTSNLTPSQRYAASALFAVALNQAQIGQTKPLGSLATEHGRDDGEQISGGGDSGDHLPQNADLWVHETSGLLRPVFSCLQIDSSAWRGLEEIAASSPSKHHIGAFVKLLSEDASESESDDPSAEAMVQSIQRGSISVEAKMEKHLKYEHECLEKYYVPEAQPGVVRDEGQNHGIVEDEKNVEEVALLSHETKISVLYKLLSACLADKHAENEKCTWTRKGYDARHHVALRLLSTWLDIMWIKMEGIETMAACSAMALQKSSGNKEEESLSPNNEWDKWKRA